MRKRNGVGLLTALTLILGLTAAVGSGWIEGIALTNPEGTWVRWWYAGVSAKMFTVSAVFVLLWGSQWQRAKFSKRLQRLEEELAALRSRV